MIWEYRRVTWHSVYSMLKISQSSFLLLAFICCFGIVFKSSKRMHMKILNLWKEASNLLYYTLGGGNFAGMGKLCLGHRQPLCQNWPSTGLVNKALLEQGPVHLFSNCLWLLSHQRGGVRQWQQNSRGLQNPKSHCLALSKRSMWTPALDCKRLHYTAYFQRQGLCV